MAQLKQKEEKINVPLVTAHPKDKTRYLHKLHEDIKQ
jgi:hypothetical protein